MGGICTNSNTSRKAWELGSFDGSCFVLLHRQNSSPVSKRTHRTTIPFALITTALLLSFFIELILANCSRVSLLFELASMQTRSIRNQPFAVDPFFSYSSRSAYSDFYW